MPTPDLYSQHHFLFLNFTNWKSRTAIRRCIPINITCGVIPHSGEDPQWALNVYMEDRGFARRSIPLSRILSMTPGGPSPLSYGKTISELQGASS